jgi:hypothetical protein
VRSGTKAVKRREAVPIPRVSLIDSSNTPAATSPHRSMSAPVTCRDCPTGEARGRSQTSALDTLACGQASTAGHVAQAEVAFWPTRGGHEPQGATRNGAEQRNPFRMHRRNASADARAYETLAEKRQLLLSSMQGISCFSQDNPGQCSYLEGIDQRAAADGGRDSELARERHNGRSR